MGKRDRNRQRNSNTRKQPQESEKTFQERLITSGTHEQPRIK